MGRSFKMTDNLINYSDIEIFEMVRSGALHTFPIDFWSGIDSLNTAKTIIKYLFENILKWTIEDIKSKPIYDLFCENRLGYMLKNLFNNSAYQAVIYAYPELKDCLKLINEDSQIKKETDEELIEILKNKAKELNKIPSIREMSNPSASSYIVRFGSWENAYKEAGLIE